MPLTALSQGERVVSIELSDQEWADLRSRARTDPAAIVLPSCGHECIPKRSSLGLKFFAHRPRQECASSGGETAEHLASKAAIIAAARSIGWQAAPEVAAPDGSWIADVLITAPSGRQIAAEVQWSAQSDEDYVARTQRYRDIGIETLWFRRRRRYEYSRATGYFAPSAPGSLVRADGEMMLKEYEFGGRPAGLVPLTAAAKAELLVRYGDTPDNGSEHAESVTLSYSIGDIVCYCCRRTGTTWSSWSADWDDWDAPDNQECPECYSRVPVRRVLDLQAIYGSLRRRGLPNASVHADYHRPDSDEASGPSCPVCRAPWFYGFRRKRIRNQRSLSLPTILTTSVAAHHCIPDMCQYIESEKQRIAAGRVREATERAKTRDARQQSRWEAKLQRRWETPIAHPQGSTPASRNPIQNSPEAIDEAYSTALSAPDYQSRIGLISTPIRRDPRGKPCGYVAVNDYRTDRPFELTTFQNLPFRGRMGEIRGVRGDQLLVEVVVTYGVPPVDESTLF